jgi:hypothetical protein
VQRGEGDVRPLSEHALKVQVRATSMSLRQSSIDAEIVLHGTLT